MKNHSLLASWRGIFQNEDVNFLLTNRIPRIALTRFVGWLSKIRSPWVSRPAIGIWKLFTDLNLSEAAHTDFASLHDCFTRRLKPGARVVDDHPEVLASPRGCATTMYFTSRTRPAEVRPSPQSIVAA